MGADLYMLTTGLHEVRSTKAEATSSDTYREITEQSLSICLTQPDSMLELPMVSMRERRTQLKRQKLVDTCKKQMYAEIFVIEECFTIRYEQLHQTDLRA